MHHVSDKICTNVAEPVRGSAHAFSQRVQAAHLVSTFSQHVRSASTFSQRVQRARSARQHIQPDSTFRQHITHTKTFQAPIEGDHKHATWVTHNELNPVGIAPSILLCPRVMELTVPVNAGGDWYGLQVRTTHIRD